MDGKVRKLLGDFPETSCEKVSEELPAGEDLEDSLEFRNLEIALQRPPAPGGRMVAGGVSAGKVRQPDWEKLAGEALALLRRSRDLRIALMLTRALVGVGGLTGLREGLDLMCRMVTVAWDWVHPRIEDSLVRRVRALQEIGSPEGLLFQAQRLPLLAGNPVLGEVDFVGLQIATGRRKPTSHDPTPRPIGDIEKALGRCDFARLESNLEKVRHCAGCLEKIGAKLGEQTGGKESLEEEIEGAPSLRKVLAELSEVFAGALAKRQDASPNGGGGNTQGKNPSGGGEEKAAGTEVEERETRSGRPGRIESREDVIRTLELVCEYLERSEPSSPVPFLLRRAQRLVSRSFRDIVQDLVPESLGRLDTIFGAAEAGKNGEIGDD